jgi:hypothetical protein
VLLTAFEFGGEPVLQATVRDLTDSKRAAIALRESDETARRSETRYRLLSDIGQALSARLDVQGLFELIAQQTARVMVAENMIIALYDPSCHEVEFVFSRNPDEVAPGARRSAESGLTGYIIRHRESVFLHGDMAAEAERQMGVTVIGPPAASWLGVPMLIGAAGADGSGGRVLGVIAVQHYTDPHAYDESDRALLEAIANQAAIALENARLYSEAQREKQYFESLVRNNPAAVVVIDRDANVLSWNPAAESLFGYSQDEAIGRDIDDLVADDAIRAEATRYSRQVGAGNMAHATTRRSRRDGSLVDVELFGVPVIIEGKPIGTLFIYHDISELQQAQRAERKQRVLAETLRDASVALTRALDLDVALETLLDTLRPLVPYDSASVMLLEDATHVAIRAERGFELWTAATQIGRTFDVETAGALRQVLQSRQSLLIADTYEYPGWDRPPGTEYIRSWLGVPLISGGEVIGVYSMDKAEVGFFTEEHARLAEMLAAHGAVAIEHARLLRDLRASNKQLQGLVTEHEQVRKAEHEQRVLAEALRDISVMLTSSLNLDQVFEGILNHVARVVPYDAASILLIRGEAVEVAHVRGFDPSLIGLQFPLQRPNLLRIIETGQPVMIDDTRTYDAWVETSETSWIRSDLAAAIRVGAEIIGFLSLDRDTPYAFTAEHVERLQTFADQAGIAVQNARLFEAEHTQRRMAESLREVAAVLNATLDRDVVLAKIMEQLRRVIHYDGAGILLHEGDALVISGGIAFQQHSLAIGHPIPLSSNDPAVRVFVDQRPLVLSDVRADPDWIDVPGTEYIKAFVGVPLLLGEKAIGILTIDSSEAGSYGDEDAHTLQAFANQAALAIENTRLYDEAQRQNVYLERARREAEAATQAKSTFLANMSHELRTPLNAIIGYSEMLMEDAEDQALDGFAADLKKIHASGKHLLDLINDVLDLSKIEAGRMDLYLESFDVAGMLQSIVSTVQPLVKTNANRLEVVADADLGVMRADLTKVRQSLFNLLSNAAKFTEHGLITLAAARERSPAGPAGPSDGVDWMTFRVSDTGIGMKPEQLERLFQVFSQADASISRKYGGTGLGLALSLRFCQMMGGDISVESTYGVGSTFTIRLPAQPAVPQSAPEPPRAVPAAPAAPGESIVLAIDDEPAVRDLVQRFLSKEGFRVVTAASGEEGLKLARELHPNAITLDVLMPGMDGWTVLAALKADPALSAIPVIMLSIVNDKNMGYALGVSEYLNKPIEREALVAALRKCQQGTIASHVLVVDDDAATREMLRRLVQGEGWTVSEAENGRVALARMAERTPALILLDLIMPEMDGFQFVVEMQRNEAWRSIPVAVITAKDLTAEDRTRLDGAVEAILQKGATSRDELLVELRSLIAAGARPGS